MTISKAQLRARRLAAAKARVLADPLHDKPKAFANRQRVWRHNSFMGHAKMMRSNLINMGTADSVTEAGKEVCGRMLILLNALDRELKTRVDPK